jgi:hypothetical protein
MISCTGGVADPTTSAPIAIASSTLQDRTKGTVR